MKLRLVRNENGFLGKTLGWILHFCLLPTNNPASISTKGEQAWMFIEYRVFLCLFAI